MRGIVTATRLGLEATISITIAGVSVVTSPDAAAADYQMLKSLLRPSGAPPPREAISANARAKFFSPLLILRQRGGCAGFPGSAGAAAVPRRGVALL